MGGCSGTGFSGQDFYDPKDVTASPTVSPTDSPTAKCDPNNCMNWECADWCECYDDEHADVYNSHEECQADGDDTCICFQEEGDEHPKEVLPGTERHRKIHYRHEPYEYEMGKFDELKQKYTDKIPEATNIKTDYDNLKQKY